MAVVRIKATGEQGLAMPGSSEGKVRVILDRAKGESFFAPTREAFCTPSEIETQRIICPACDEPALTPGMFSEDGAAVFDQRCPNCGASHYEYIGSDDGARVWDAFHAKFRKVWI